MFSKILYATDWSDCSERAKAYLRPFQQVGAAEVIVANVIEQHFTDIEQISDVIRTELQRESEEKLRVLETQLIEWGFKVRTFLLKGGRAYKNIIELASQEDISMIVMGSHGRGLLAETMWGSVSQRVCEYSDKTVLVVK